MDSSHTHTADSFKHMKVIKRFVSRGNSLSVVLLQDPDTSEKVVRKTYDRKHRDHIRAFHHETKILAHLEELGWKWCPRLLYVDKDHLTFFETFVGSKLPHSDKYQHKAEARNRELYAKCGYAYIQNGAFRAFNFRGNYAVMNGDVYQLDFGSPRWTYIGMKSAKSAKSEKHMCKKCSQRH